jgi:hypothetical protein
MKTIVMLAASAALTIAAGCASSTGAANAPDEFRVVKKAPLVVPPDYNLRPPQSGQAQPFEVDEARAGIATAFGSNVGASASASERSLVAAAGANSVSPVIREQVDFEEAKTIRKSVELSDRVMFWKKGDDEDTSDTATGGEPVIIERGTGQRLKLPGT